MQSLMLLPILFLGAYLLKNPYEGAGSVQRGLSLFCFRLLPALFPMSVISSVFCRAGRIPGIPVSGIAKLLGIDKKTATALIFGLFAGFPVGAMAIGELYRKGEIDRDEAESMLGVVSNPGAAFLIGGVGSALFGDVRVGLILYLSQTVLILLLLIFRRILHCDSRNSHSVGMDHPEPLPMVRMLTESVSTAVTGMLSVCGQVVFFSVLTDFVGHLADYITNAPWVDVWISGILEIGSGMQAASGVGGLCGILIAAAFAGWSGLCVCLQIAGVSGGLSMRRYLTDRLILSLLMPLTALGFLRLFGMLP
ncbi:MAG: hypothetical protein ACI3YK_04560 [Eubacteriales bacterium]